MPISTLVLANPYVEVQFSGETGNPVHLSEPGGSTLLTDCFCQYVTGESLITENSDGEKGPKFEVVRVTPSQNAVESIVRAPGLKIVRRFELEPESPLLKVTHTAEGTGELKEIHHPAFPRICFTEDFTDAFEDEEDLFFDGVELGDGRELPCWRVFFRTGHREGLIVATRSKYDMSHFQIYERGFDILPHLMTAYDSNIPLVTQPMSVGRTRSTTATFEIGPWTAARHDTLLKTAGLDRPHRVSPRDTEAPEPTEALPEDLPGILFDILDVAEPSAVSQEYRTDRWMVVRHPVYRGGKALIAGPGVSPPPITLDPKLNGVYRIFAGIGIGNGFTGRLSGDDMPTFRIPHTLPHATPFYLKLSGPQKAQELLIRTAEMDGRTLQLEGFPGSSATTVLDYVRFEALTPKGEAEWKAEEARESGIELSGFNDIPDIKKFTDLHNPPNPNRYKRSIFHARGKYNCHDISMENDHRFLQGFKKNRLLYPFGITQCVYALASKSCLTRRTSRKIFSLILSILLDSLEEILYTYIKVILDIIHPKDQTTRKRDDSYQKNTTSTETA